MYDGGGRVVDVRGGVMLYEGNPPSDLGLTRVEAPVDATLTFDGRYVLDWSSRLRATDGSPDLVLEQGPTSRMPSASGRSTPTARCWWPGRTGRPGSSSTTATCPRVPVRSWVPSTRCGDPLFIGVDV